MASLFYLAASQLLFYLETCFPLFFPRPAPYSDESILAQTIFIFTHGVFVERFSCFRVFVIRCAMDVVGPISNFRFLSTCVTKGVERHNVRRTGRGRLYSVFPECLRLISESFRSPPFSAPIWSASIQDVFAHLIRRFAFAFCR